MEPLLPIIHRYIYQFNQTSLRNHFPFFGVANSAPGQGANAGSNPLACWTSDDLKKSHVALLKTGCPVPPMPERLRNAQPSPAYRTHHIDTTDCKHAPLTLAITTRVQTAGSWNNPMARRFFFFLFPSSARFLPMTGDCWFLNLIFVIVCYPRNVASATCRLRAMV